MSIITFPEKEIRKQIKSKINPKIQGKRSKHQKGCIYIDDKLVAKVKLPNDHNVPMKQSKTKYIANDLKLDYDEFNQLIQCPLTGPAYYDLLKNRT